MATKHKLSKKRGNEYLGDTTTKVFEASEITISRSKRRKNGNGETLNLRNQGVDAQLQSYGQVMPNESQQRCSNKNSYIEEGKNIFSVIGASSKEKYVRNRYKKTYAALSKIGLFSNQIKSKQNVAANIVAHSKTSKNVKYKNAVGDNIGRKKQHLVLDSANRLLTVSNDMQLTDCEEASHHCTTQVNNALRNEKASMIYVQSPSFLDGKTQKTNAKKSWSSLTDSEYSKEKCNSLSSVISTKSIPHVNHSHNSVLKPVAKLTGIPTTSPMPSLNANTSAITAITTPIPTFPVLPDVIGDVSRSEVDCLDQTILTRTREDVCSSSTSQQMDKPDPGCSSVKDRTKIHYVSSKSCNGTNQHNQNLVFPFKHTELYIDIPLPVVDISSESGNVSLKEESSVSPADNLSHGKTNSHPLGTMNSYTNSQQPSILQVDTWAAHVLQNLELLYKNDWHCDLSLKFCGGEVLMVHRTILLACTSLASDPDALLDKNELVVPADLNFASVEPVIRFVYSGCLEIHKSTSKMSEIYAAAKRLQVPLLTHIMDQHFPHLSPSCIESSTSLEDSMKHMKPKKQVSTKSKASPQSGFLSSNSKCATSGSTLEAAMVGNEQEADTKDIKDVDDVETMKMEECEGQDTALYYLVNNSREHSYSTTPGRCVKTEEARPTRFELEEDSENSPLKTATLCTQSSSTCHHTTSFSSPSSFSPPSIALAPQVGTSNLTPPPLSPSALVGSTSSDSCSLTNSGSSQAFRKCLSSSNVKVKVMQPHLTKHLSNKDQIMGSKDTNKTLQLVHDINATSEGYKCSSEVDNHDNDHITENESTKENVELVEKISSICRQLEEKEPNELQTTNLRGEKSNEEPHSLSTGRKTCINEESMRKVTLTPVKSILKKNKNKARVHKEAKHVSFQLDENNELINEVATFSLSKEPAQSLIEVQKTRGNVKPVTPEGTRRQNTKSLGDTCSPVKLSVSMKKKMLMNLSLSDSESIGLSSRQVKKSHGKKSVNTSSQGHSLSYGNKGQITSHAKIISEVLKKYPHLVKDKKKIRLKILQKGNEKEGGGKAKSKVNFLVLSDGDSLSKSVTKTYKTSSSSKDDLSIPQPVQSQYAFECSECINLTFKTYFKLKKHVSAEHKDKVSAILSRIENVPFACYTCFANEPLEFNNYFGYQQHMKDVHSKTEIRICNICGFRPGRKLELAYHQYTEHNKVSRNFCFPKCDLCHHVAINDAALLKHRSQHTNADNYTCSVCGVKFCSFGALHGHMQTKLCQTKPSVSHKCPHCPLTFARSYNLKAHCKSSHKFHQSSTQSMSEAKEKQSQDLTPQNAGSQSETETERRNDLIKIHSNSTNEKDNINAVVECETVSVVNTRSSEAEALSTVANSLAASLGLPEETINQYMYSQDNKMDFTNTMGGEKVEHVVSQAGGVAVHLEVPEYQDNLSCTCFDEPNTVQTSVQEGNNMNTLFPVSVVQSEVLPMHIVPGQIIPAGCINPSNGPVVGDASQSWTYVTYQVPSANDDLPVVVTETTFINTPGNSHQNTSTGSVYQSTTNLTTVEDIEVNDSDINCTEITTVTETEMADQISPCETHL